jgi:hypothetical protein
MARHATRAAIAAMLLASSWGAASVSCGAGEQKPPVTVTHLTIWNRSEFELLELYATPDTHYAGAENHLSQPLLNEARVTIPFASGEYVTVVRRRVAGGERIAFTTAEPIEPRQDYSILVVFQESFRLEPPEDQNMSDDGAPSGGD